ncbi:MAG: 16S rRNA (guanine(527)-N(7))-methyltransferase RsmG [Mycoplasmoidaceae bacterium]|nr:MAG: 16S rRNA (guanine(527)-N(7))-methyltransferase RsmG [Mycoplasmoidaceae bacterium]
MDKLVFTKNVNENFKNININFFSQIEIYKIFLQEYNKKTNLTRLDSEDKIYGEYFLDSVLPYKSIEFKKDMSILDIGSGSGIPGIVLKLLYPQIVLTIIESNGKKVTFLKELCKKLNIEVTIYMKRAEDIRNNEREKYDIVTSRAVSELCTILEVSIPYCKVGGLIIEPKGSHYKDEFENAKKIILATKIELINTISYDTTYQNNILVFKKNEITDKIYPRKWNEIIKDEQSN